MESQGGRLVKIVAAIPTGHRHLRMILFFDDGRTVLLTEALAAGIARAYIDVVTHPTRRGVVLCVKEVDGKPGYAKVQLVECGGEEEAVAEVDALLERLGPAKG
ncbi:hypothetical protein [Pyrobaculum aerophilum]|uniref:Uncharacterized protein n=1 Tax=Pyrobaculum aerophilum TaxID=13773 RepID=A0A371R7B8_9CREN|nr:hypothetical protein [Pyrobaculum aerophilum]RFA94010.1 hypothetical protein CGL51_11315 [Pyrobaculum aerophilum]RFB00410.1 hypothetical protein CGL52_00695 [Pyrobaculum aerophilum]